MEKMISFPEKRVRDLSGLFLTLKKAGYAVRNVGADEFGTYVYLEADEEKDPVDLIEEWVGKPAPDQNNARAFKSRKEEIKKAEEEGASARAAEEAARIAASTAEKVAAFAAAQASIQVAAANEGGGDPILVGDEPLLEVPAPEKKESIFKRMLKALW